MEYWQLISIFDQYPLTMKNLLITLDLKDQEHCDQMLKHTISLAKAYAAKCWLIHIAEPDPEFVSYGSGPQYIRDEIAEELRAEHRQIQRFADKLKAEDINCDGLMIQGPTEQMILEEIKKLNIDLLVIGNKKRGFLQELFVGSITNDLIKDVSIPIFLVPLPKK